MRDRRRPKGTPAVVSIETDADYRQALMQLEALQKAPLGTNRTEGLQDLIEAILEYEDNRGRMDGADFIQ